MKTRQLTTISLFVAINIVFSQLIIPIQPVPISLSMISVYLSGALLGSKAGALVQIIYLILGAVGLPIFAGAKGGISVLVGPTGGYLLGYILTAFVVGKFCMEDGNIKNNKLIPSMLFGLILCYALGTIHLSYVAGMSISQALFAGVVPFILGDILKIFISYVLIVNLKDKIKGLILA